MGNKKPVKYMLTCQSCEKVFDKREYDVGRKYCSPGCYYWGTVGDDVSKSGCWLWRGRIDRQGYGAIRFNKMELSAHRIGYSAWHGLDQTTQEAIYNICGHRDCVRGDHWEPKNENK